VTLSPLGVGLVMIPGTLRAMRRLENAVRRRSADWCGVAIAVPYLPERARGADELSLCDVEPAMAGSTAHKDISLGFWSRFLLLLADPATWRDLLWTGVDMLFGWMFTLAPLGLLAWGLFGVVMPAVWHPITAAGGNNWYAFIHVTNAASAWLSVPLGVAFITSGLLSGPWLLRRYVALAHGLLAPRP
ncbi:MAG: sensor domain-containing protein, partial [Trebonia sp.]